MFTNVTISSKPMKIVRGMKQSGSHPGEPEPCAFSTVYVAANALGTASPITKSTTNDDMINCDFVDL